MTNAHTVFSPCPLTKQHIAECDIVFVTGASIPRISRYCIGNYASCPVYRAQRRSDNVPEEPVSVGAAASRQT